MYTCSRKEDDLTVALAEWQGAGLKVQGCVADDGHQSQPSASSASTLQACFLACLADAAAEHWLPGLSEPVSARHGAACGE